MISILKEEKIPVGKTNIPPIQCKYSSTAEYYKRGGGGKKQMRGKKQIQDTVIDNGKNVKYGS